MKAFLFLILFCSTLIFCSGQSQGEMNDAAVKNYQKADKELNSVYQQILKRYSEDKVFISNLKMHKDFGDNFVMQK